MHELYTKSRKSYLLASVILLAWQKFDFRITKIPGLDAGLTQEQTLLVPNFLALICLYLAYRVTVDWLFFAPSKTASRLDFVVVHAIGFVALLIYFYDVFFADIEIYWIAVAEGLALCMYSLLFLGSFSTRFLNRVSSDSVIAFIRERRIALALWGGTIVVTLLIITFQPFETNYFSFILGAIVTVLLLVVIFVSTRLRAFISDSDAMVMVSQIERAFAAERELKELKRSRMTRDH